MFLKFCHLFFILCVVFISVHTFAQTENSPSADNQSVATETLTKAPNAALSTNVEKGMTLTILSTASLLLIGIATFIVMSTIFMDESSFKASEKLQDGSVSTSKSENLKNAGPILRYSRPFFRRYVSPIVATLKNKKKIRDRYRRKLATAGLTEILNPDDFFAFKLFLIIAFPLVFVVLRIFLEADWSFSMIPFLAVGGYIYPDIWINSKIRERQKEVIMGMPFCVDMLALSVEAGLDFIVAMRKVIQKAKPGPLTEEFGIVIREIGIGASRAEALRNMAWRIDLIQIASFTATLIAADSVGASIGPILKALSKEVREKRSADIEKAGATATTKILLPLIFLIVPAVLIMIAAPMMKDVIGK